MGSFKIYSTLFIIGAVVVCSTESLSPMLFSLQNFIGAEDHAATAKISTPQPTTPQTTTTTESPHHHHNVEWQDLSLAGKVILIALASVLTLILVLSLFCVLDAYIGSRKGWGRKFYFAFRDNVCCGFCVRRMGKGKMYEYEEI